MNNSVDELSKLAISDLTGDPADVGRGRVMIKSTGKKIGVRITATAPATIKRVYSATRVRKLKVGYVLVKIDSQDTTTWTGNDVHDYIASLGDDNEFRLTFECPPELANSNINAGIKKVDADCVKDDLIQLQKHIAKYNIDPTMPVRNDGLTLLHIAAENGSFNCIRYLIELSDNKLYVLDRDDYGLTPVDRARGKGHSHIANFLELCNSKRASVESKMMNKYKKQNGEGATDDLNDGMDFDTARTASGLTI